MQRTRIGLGDAYYNGPGHLVMEVAYWREDAKTNLGFIFAVLATPRHLQVTNFSPFHEKVEVYI